MQIDPSYAAPYAGMVECFNTLGVFHLMAPLDEVRDATIRYAEQALFLDPTSPDSLFAFGYTQFYMRWDWAGAEAAFLKCLSINPNHSIAHSFLSLLYSTLGRHEESRQHTDAAKRIDPYSTLTWWMSSLHYHYAREFEEGLVAARRGLELHPDDVLINWAIADSLVRLGRMDEALPAVDRLHELTAEFPLYRACSGILYKILGKPGEANRIYSELGLDAAEVQDPFICGLLTIYVGEPEHALSMLERAESANDPLLWVIAREPYYDPLRGERRFIELMSRLGLPADNLPIHR
jgi:tetratricopeptide (TPR) repeat protein